MDLQTARLRDYPYVRVRVACVWCPRRQGDYRLADLAARLGPDCTLADALERISRRCRRPKPWNVRGPNAYAPWCRATFVNLGKPADEPTPPGIPARSSG